MHSPRGSVKDRNDLNIEPFHPHTIISQHKTSSGCLKFIDYPPPLYSAELEVECEIPQRGLLVLEVKNVEFRYAPVRAPYILYVDAAPNVI